MDVDGDERREKKKQVQPILAGTCHFQPTDSTLVSIMVNAAINYSNVSIATRASLASDLHRRETRVDASGQRVLAADEPDDFSRIAANPSEKHSYLTQNYQIHLVPLRSRNSSRCRSILMTGKRSSSSRGGVRIVAGRGR